MQTIDFLIENPWWLIGSLITFVMIVFIIKVVYKRSLIKADKTDEEIETIKHIWLAFFISTSIVILVGFFLWVLLSPGESNFDLDKIAASTGVLIGTPATLAASFVALVLALRSLQLSKKQTDLEEKIEQRSDEQEKWNQFLLDKKTIDNLFIDYFAALSNFINVSSVIYDSLYESELSVTERLGNDFEQARTDLKLAVSNIARNSMANQVWSSVVNKKGISNESLYNFCEPFEVFDRFKYYLPEKDFQANYLVEFLNRVILLEKYDFDSFYKKRIDEVRWSFASDMIQNAFRPRNALEDILAKRTIKVRGKSIIHEKFNLVSWIVHDMDKLGSISKFRNDSTRVLLLDFLMGFETPELERYKSIIKDKFESFGHQIELDEWLSFVYKNAFNDDESSNRPVKSKLILAGYLLASGDKSKRFIVDMNLGAILLKNFILVSEEYFSSSEHLEKVFYSHMRGSSISESECKSFVSSFLNTHFNSNLYQFGEETITAVQQMDDSKVGLFIGKGQELRSSFYRDAMNLSVEEFFELDAAFDVDIYDDREFWDRIINKVTSEFYSYPI